MQARGPKSNPALLAPQRTRVVTLDRIGLFHPAAQRIKRLSDLLFVAVLAAAALIPALLIALAIRLDSRGSIFFSQTRVGKGRRPFRIWKFRSMVRDADERLDAFLRENPARAAEWARTHKLRHDPRVTRVGRFLRKTSLDELPQLWNILRGEMSMIGPRPIVATEIPKYGSAIALYSQVRPGLTGLWQVSGRNDTNYGRRVDLDCQYIRRWNYFSDLAILLKTVRVVIGGRGAY